MAQDKKLTWQFDNEFIPTYIPPYAKRDGLETWYRQNKCQEFLENTNEHFKQRKLVNFHMINEKLDEKTISNIKQSTIKKLNSIQLNIEIK